MAASQLLITDFLAGNIGLIAINLFNLFRSTFTRFCYLLFTGWTLTLMTLNWTLMTAITTVKYRYLYLAHLKLHSGILVPQGKGAFKIVF